MNPDAVGFLMFWIFIMFVVQIFCGFCTYLSEAMSKRIKEDVSVETIEAEEFYRVYFQHIRSELDLCGQSEKVYKDDDFLIKDL
jgi:hypothetical protein